MFGIIENAASNYIKLLYSLHLWRVNQHCPHLTKRKPFGSKNKRSITTTNNDNNNSRAQNDSQLVKV